MNHRWCAPRRGDKGSTCATHALGKSESLRNPVSGSTPLAASKNSPATSHDSCSLTGCRPPDARTFVDITRPLGEMMDACSTTRRAAEVRRSSYWQPPVRQERSTVAEQFGFSPAPGESVPYRLDHIDRQIVALLLKDGRMSCAAIARSIGRLSERAIV